MYIHGALSIGVFNDTVDSQQVIVVNVYRGLLENKITLFALDNVLRNVKCLYFYIMGYALHDDMHARTMHKMIIIVVSVIRPLYTMSTELHLFTNHVVTFTS